MLKQKYFLVTFSIFIFGPIITLAGGETLKKADGSILYMTHFEATGVNPTTLLKERPDACEASGKGYLPTIRELAMEIHSRSVMDVNSPTFTSEGYNNITAIDPNGQKDVFFFRQRSFGYGFEPSTDDAVWSASIRDREPYSAFYLSNWAGFLASANRGYKLPIGVRCFTH